MRGKREHGGAAVEFVIIAPVLIMMFLFIVGLGRMATAREAVEGAARDGAREASIARSAGAADSTARQVIADTLANKRITCTNPVSGQQATPDVKVDTGNFHPDGTVTVHVACMVDNSAVMMSGLPGHKTLHSDFTAWVDKYRGTQ